jgi:hypothetical protein
MVSDDKVTEYVGNINRVLKDAPDFEAIFNKMSPILRTLGLPENPIDLIGRKVAVMWAAGDVEDASKAESDFPEFIDSVPSMGWELHIVDVKDDRYNGGNQNPAFDGIAIKTDVITFSLDHEKPGMWSQDWWPNDGKYKFL